MTRISLFYRLKVIILLSLCFTIGYGFTNRFPVFSTTVLPFTPIDDWFGFRPWTVWFYISDYLLIFFPAILITNLLILKRFLKAFFINFAIHFPIFFFFPTIMVRPPVVGESLTAAVFNLVRWIDTPVNCFPSQHVSLCFVVAVGFWNYKRSLSILFIIWSILISLSTMTTKQHYFWDVLGGLAVAFVVCMIAYRKEEKPKIILVESQQTMA